MPIIFRFNQMQLYCFLLFVMHQGQDVCRPETIHNPVTIPPNVGFTTAIDFAREMLANSEHGHYDFVHA